eukprot:SAG22_NODE_8260_length_669_cov_1.924561_2_plen_88_part_00
MHVDVVDVSAVGVRVDVVLVGGAAEEKEGRLCSVGDDPMEKDCVLTTCGHTFARTNITNWLIGGTSTRTCHPSQAPGTVPGALRALR